MGTEVSRIWLDGVRGRARGEVVGWSALPQAKNGDRSSDHESTGHGRARAPLQRPEGRKKIPLGLRVWAARGCTWCEEREDEGHKGRALAAPLSPPGKAFDGGSAGGPVGRQGNTPYELAGLNAYLEWRTHGAF